MSFQKIPLFTYFQYVLKILMYYGTGGISSSTGGGGQKIILMHFHGMYLAFTEINNEF